MACENTSKKFLKCSLWIILPVLAASIVVLVLFPTIYKRVLNEELCIERGTIATKVFEDIPLPIFEKLYFFNITNGDAFMNGSETLNVVEVGPYTYKASWVKPNMEWNSNYTVSYRELKTYQFVPDLSNGTEDDQIYTLNGPLIFVSYLAKNYDLRIKTLLTTLLGIAGEKIIIKRSIKQLAYGGYEDLLIKFAPIIKPNVPYKNGIFCWLSGRNNTDEGLFNVFTGSDDPSKRNIINAWNGENKLSFWKGDTCNEMSGTNVEYGPPIRNDQSSYTFFQSFFCRSLTFNYTEDVTHFGIPSKRFRPTYSLYANSTENPDNYCFETTKQNPSGVLDVSSCQFGAPIYLSNPHFYMADPSYLNIVDGLNPNDEDHGSALDVELVTGFTINAFVRFQVNIEINTVEGILQTYNITNGIFPIFWVDIGLSIDEKFANYLKSKTHNPKIIAYSVLGILAGVSLILAVVFIVILYIRKSDNDIDDPLIDAVDEGNQGYNKIANDNKGYSKRTSYDNNWKEKLEKVDEDDETDEEASNDIYKHDSETSKLLK